MTEQSTPVPSVTAEDAVPETLLRHLEVRTGRPLAADQELFASGLISSMLAMEIVVYLEDTFGVTIAGSDLNLAHFRTIETMAALVRRLRGVLPAAGDA